MLILLLATAAVIPAFTALKLSPILGFLLSGCVLGPNGLSLVSDVHTIEVLAEFGVVFFLFEMGEPPKRALAARTRSLALLVFFEALLATPAQAGASPLLCSTFPFLPYLTPLNSVPARPLYTTC